MKKLNLMECVPPFWARGGHTQTLLGHLMPSERLHNLGLRVEIPLGDGDRLVGFLLSGTSRTVVYLFHGLSGSTNSTYIHRTARVAHALGHSVFMVNHRSCGEGARLAQHPYHSGRGEDLSAAIEWGRRQFSRHRHLAIGFSLSGNALLLLLSGRRGSVKPDCAISVNAPIDLESAAIALQSGFNRVYDFRFFVQCRKDVLFNRSEGAIPYQLPLFATLRDFDQAYTAPAGGFRDREDYYRSCSTRDLLSAVSIPTVVLTSMDDPFVHHGAYLKAQPSAHVLLHIEQHGGHMGYICSGKTPLGTKRWLDYALTEAIKSLTTRGNNFLA